MVASGKTKWITKRGMTLCPTNRHSVSLMIDFNNQIKSAYIAYIQAINYCSVMAIDFNENQNSLQCADMTTNKKNLVFFSWQQDEWWFFPWKFPKNKNHLEQFSSSYIQSIVETSKFTVWRHLGAALFASNNGSASDYWVKWHIICHVHCRFDQFEWDGNSQVVFYLCHLFVQSLSSFQRSSRPVPAVASNGSILCSGNRQAATQSRFRSGQCIRLQRKSPETFSNVWTPLTGKFTYVYEQTTFQMAHRNTLNTKHFHNETYNFRITSNFLETPWRYDVEGINV